MILIFDFNFIIVILYFGNFKRNVEFKIELYSISLNCANLYGRRADPTILAMNKCGEMNYYAKLRKKI